jgi:protoheme IX farnesyltransferase
MKAGTQFFEVALAAEKNRFAVLADLLKARLTLLVIFTALVGFYLGATGPVDYPLLCHTLLGTGLVAAGAAALNQLFERRFDAKMLRTQDRPLPSGRLRPRTVLVLGCAMSALGLGYLALAVNLLTATLGAVTLFLYLFVYTPLKRLTWLNTLVGAVPGALPPLMGWTAARGELGSEGLALFAIQAFWQIPHFMAIAWIHRDDYARAGFKMLPVVEPEGWSTARHALICALGLLLVSLCPFLSGLSGALYLGVAVSLGLLFLWCSIRFSRRLTVTRARQMFFVSILYLPLLLGAMVVDKVKL